MTADGYDDEMGESFIWEPGDLDQYPATREPITLAEIDRRRQQDTSRQGDCSV